MPIQSYIIQLICLAEFYDVFLFVQHYMNEAFKNVVTQVIVFILKQDNINIIINDKVAV